MRSALEYFRRLNEAAKDERHHRRSVIDLGESASTISAGTGPASVTKSTSSHSMRSKRSAGTTRSRSRSTEQDPDNATIAELDNPESSDPETATEVEISEKTLKFKISTEGTGTMASCGGRKSYPGSRKGSRDKSSLDYYNHDLAKAVRDHERERRRSRGENLSSDMSSPVSARSIDDGRIIEELERDETRSVKSRIRDDRPEGNGKIVAKVESFTDKEGNEMEDEKPDGDEENDDDFHAERKDSMVRNDSLHCCCDDKTAASNNHKSLLSRLRNFTDRLSISFDSKDAVPCTKSSSKHHASSRSQLLKSESVTSSSNASATSAPKQPRQNNSLILCKRCNLTKMSKNEIKDTSVTTRTTRTTRTTTTTVVEIDGMEKRATTLPKAKKSQDKNKSSWRIVFVKEKRPSISLETLPAVGDDVDTSGTKHKRNLSNPEGKIPVNKTQSLKHTRKNEKPVNINDFKEFDVRKTSIEKPEIIVNPGSSNVVDVDDDDIGKIEIRRSSASMEDISKITKQNENILVGCGLEEKKSDEHQQHTGSLDSMLYKETSKSGKKSLVGLSSPYSAKKSSPGIFSRFKSGMSIDGTRSTSNSSSLNDQTSQQQTGWISSLTASFRPKRQSTDLQSALPHALQSPGHEGVK